MMKFEFMNYEEIPNSLYRKLDKCLLRIISQNGTVTNDLEVSKHELFRFISMQQNENKEIPPNHDISAKMEEKEMSLTYQIQI